jgi:hypothetical protein
VLRNADCPLSLTSNRCITVENTLALGAVVFRACKIIHIFYVFFCVFITVHKSGFWLFINGSSNQWRPVERMQSNNRDSSLLHDLRIFFPTVVASIKGL